MLLSEWADYGKTVQVIVQVIRSSADKATW